MLKRENDKAFLESGKRFVSIALLAGHKAVVYSGYWSPDKDISHNPAGTAIEGQT